MEHKHKIWTGTIFLVVGLVMLFLVPSNAFTGNVANQANRVSGSISFLSSNEETKVYLDDRLVGTTIKANDGTPFIISNVIPGSHSIKLSKQDYQSYIKNNVRVTARKVTDLGRITLASTFASLYVNSNPIGARVYINNTLYDRDYANLGLTPQTFSRLVPGIYSLNFSLPGYRHYTTNVNIKANTLTQVNANLIIAPPVLGSIKVDSNPSNLYVSLDNSYVRNGPYPTDIARTPYTITNINQGSHTVTISSTINSIFYRCTKNVNLGYGQAIDLGTINLLNNCIVSYP